MHCYLQPSRRSAQPRARGPSAGRAVCCNGHTRCSDRVKEHVLARIPCRAARRPAYSQNGSGLCWLPTSFAFALRCVTAYGSYVRVVGLCLASQPPASGTLWRWQAGPLLSSASCCCDASWLGSAADRCTRRCTATPPCTPFVFRPLRASQHAAPDTPAHCNCCLAAPQAAPRAGASSSSRRPRRPSTPSTP